MTGPLEGTRGTDRCRTVGTVAIICWAKVNSGAEKGQRNRRYVGKRLFSTVIWIGKLVKSCGLDTPSVFRADFREIARKLATLTKEWKIKVIGVNHHVPRITFSIALMLHRNENKNVAENVCEVNVESMDSWYMRKIWNILMNAILIDLRMMQPLIGKKVEDKNAAKNYCNIESVFFSSVSFVSRTSGSSACCLVPVIVAAAARLFVQGQRGRHHRWRLNLVSSLHTMIRVYRRRLPTTVFNTVCHSGWCWWSGTSYRWWRGRRSDLLETF